MLHISADPLTFARHEGLGGYCPWSASILWAVYKWNAAMVYIQAQVKLHLRDVLNADRWERRCLRLRTISTSSRKGDQASSSKTTPLHRKQARRESALGVMKRLVVGLVVRLGEGGSAKATRTWRHARTVSFKVPLTKCRSLCTPYLGGSCSLRTGANSWNRSKR